MKTGSPLLRRSVLVGALALGWASSCGSSNVGARATLGPAGGTLAIPSEGVRLDVPPGALVDSVEVALRATSDSRGILVGVEPAQLTLVNPASLTISIARAAHIVSVTEVTASGVRPLGIESRLETPSALDARLRLDRFLQVRVSTEVLADGGSAPGACREQEGEDGEGHEDRGESGDGGSTASMPCPAGFECDDGVCIAQGGDDQDEHRDGGNR